MSVTGGLGKVLKSTNSSSSPLLARELENALALPLQLPSMEALTAVPFLDAIFLMDLESMVLRKRGVLLDASTARLVVFGLS